MQNAKIFLLILIGALLPLPQAFAAKVVFMINMNYSPDELKTLKKVAAARDQELVVVPPEESNQEAAQFESARIRLEKKIKSIHPDWDDIQRLNALLEIQKLGSSYNKDSAIASGASAEMEDFHQQFMKVEEMEAKLGTIDQQIRKKLDQLKAQGKTIDSLVISAHSDGTNLSGETSYNMNGYDVFQLSQDYPEMFKSPRHVLLMGCYTMTKTNHKFWRGSMFPSASLIAGFSPRAPVRTDPNNLKFIEDVMAKAGELDKKMASTGKPVTKEEVAKIFLALKAVSQTRYNPVIDYCTFTVEGKPELKLSCAEEWNLLLDQAQSVQEVYLNLDDPQKDPPRDTSFSDVRRFYNDLQEICPASELSEISEEEQIARSEYVDSMVIMTRNLLFWWNVQANFSFCKQNEIQSLKERLAEAGVDGNIPKLDGNTSWVEFVQSMNEIRSSLRYRGKSLKAERQQYASIPYGASSYEKQEILNRRQDIDAQMRSLEAARDQFATMETLFELNEDIPMSWHNPGTSPSRCTGEQ